MLKIVHILIFSPNLQNKSVNFIALRLNRIGAQVTCKNSLIINVTLPDCKGNVENVILKDPNAAWVGWEKNERGKFGPRMCNMKNALDPVRYNFYLLFTTTMVFNILYIHVLFTDWLNQQFF